MTRALVAAVLILSVSVDAVPASSQQDVSAENAPDTNSH